MPEIPLTIEFIDDGPKKGGQVDLNHASQRRKNMEIAIQSFLNAKLEKFEKETGCIVADFSIETVKNERIGMDARLFVSEVRVKAYV